MKNQSLSLCFPTACHRLSDPPPRTKNAAPTAMGNGVQMIGKAGSSSVHHNKRNNQSSATSNYAYLWLVWAAHAGTWHLFGAHGEHDLKTTDEGTYRDPGDAMMAACMLMNFHPDASFSMTRIGGVG